MATVLNKMKLSFKQAFVGVMAVSMLCALILSSLVMNSLTNIQQNSQIITGTSYEENTFDGYDLNTNQIYSGQEEQKADQFILIIITWVPLVFFFLSTIFAASLFYRWKMKTPLSILNTAIENIKNNELDFSVQYNVKDEMGELIIAFESMRKELHTSFTSQWRAQEDRMLLNAAFAHDIRTPLTVLKGQVDVLTRNVTMDRIEREKVIDTLNLLARHISYIENYTDNMSALQRLEEIQINKKDIEWSNFWPVIQRNLEQLAEMRGKKICFECKVSPSHINMDESVITRILDNVVTNAVRHAKSNIEVKIEITENLVIEVCDDGSGFSKKGLQHALEPFYQEAVNNYEHPSEGIGLYICKVLVEKHDGKIMLTNGSLGGGCVTVELYNVSQL